MVKYMLSFLISFKKLGENDVQTVNEMGIKIRTSEEKREPSNCCYFKPHSDRKNICNIAYSLPGSKDFIETKLSMAYWSKMFKVYSKREDMTFRTALHDGKRWAGFTIQHKYEDLDLNQLKDIYPRAVEFRFNDDMNSVLQRVRSDKGGIYRCPKIDESSEINFQLMCQVQEKLTQTTNKQSKSKSNSNTLSGGRNIRSPTKSTKSLKMSSKSKIIESELCRMVTKIHLRRLVKAIRKSEPGDDSADCSGSGSCLVFPVFYFFCDRPFWVLKNEKPISSNIGDIYVFVTARSFLRDATRMYLNPFTINVQSLQDLPMKEVQAEGIKKICVEYELEPIIPKSRTKYQDSISSSVISFNDLKVFLTDEFSLISIISTLQSKKLFLRVLGMREVPYKQHEILNNGIYGSDLNDDRISSCMKGHIKNSVPIRPKNSKISLGKSKRIKNKNVSRRTFPLKMKMTWWEIVSLGFAKIDLSPLIFGSSCVFSYEQLSSQSVLNTAPDPDSKFDISLINRFNITDVHSDKSKFEKGILLNRSLTKNNAMLKITVKCGFLLTPRLIKTHLRLQESFSRTIVIFVDKQFATCILKKILMINKETLRMKDYNLPLVPLRKLFEVESPPVLKSFFTLDQRNFSTETFMVNLDDAHSTESVQDRLESWFTGFCIDCVNMVIMYLEGPTENVFPSLLTELVKFNASQGRIIYSSDLIYDSRLYGVFKELGGVYCITMKSTVDELLSKGTSLCHEAAVPVPAWEALKMISKLIICKTVLEGVQNNYLPQPEQLLSFDIEFGLPHCKEK